MVVTNPNFVGVILLLLLISSIASANKLNGIFNVRDYGAMANGKKDSTKAFQRAWDDACNCNAKGEARVLIPKGTYLVGALKFKGPCKGPMRVQLKGVLFALTDLRVYGGKSWIEFKYVHGLRLYGRGKLDGRGNHAWPHNDCRFNPNCKHLPASLVLSFVRNATISRITSMNSKLAHVYIFASENLKLNLLSIKAPDESPNTDGIHISESKNVTVTNSVIGTGDDCISVLSGSMNIFIFNVSCGPGHGISVGSLGRSYGDKDVSKLIVRNCTFIGTQNGVRIKSWPSSPVTTSASYFIFEDIVMKDVQNPIIIDQKYCPHNICDMKSPSRVKISHVKFRNIRGTTTTAVAVNLLCSDAVPCTNVELSDIHLKYTGRQPATATTSCINVRGFSNGNTKPRSCI